MNENLLNLQVAQLQTRARAIEVLLTTTIATIAETNSETRKALEGLLGYLNGYLSNLSSDNDAEAMRTITTCSDLKRLIEEIGRQTNPPLKARTALGVVAPNL